MHTARLKYLLFLESNKHSFSLESLHLLFPSHGNLQVLPFPCFCLVFISVQMLLYPICPMSVEWTYSSIWINACVEYISRCKIASFGTNCSCLSFSNPLLLYSSLPHLCLFYFSPLKCPFRMVLWVCLLFLPWKAGLEFSPPPGISEEKEALGSWSDPRALFLIRLWFQEWPWGMTELLLNNLIDERITSYFSHIYFSPNVWY